MNDWEHMAKQVTDLLAQKQEDYGPENILTTGHVGLSVRLTDKVARLRNLQGKHSPKFESVRDTYMDIAGYAIIGMMLLDGTFPPEELPLIVIETEETQW